MVLNNLIATTTNELIKKESDCDSELLIDNVFDTTSESGYHWNNITLCDVFSLHSVTSIQFASASDTA